MNRGQPLIALSKPWSLRSRSWPPSYSVSRPSRNSDPRHRIHLRPLSLIRRVGSSNLAFHLQPFILVSPSNAAPSCQMLTLYLSPTIVVSHRGIQDSVRHHTTLWTGQLAGELPFESRDFPAALRFSCFRRRSERCLIGRLRAERRLVFWRRYGREIGASLISPLNSALWRQSAGGIQKRSGICFFMDSLITSRTRSTHWNYPRHWMG